MEIRRLMNGQLSASSRDRSTTNDMHTKKKINASESRRTNNTKPEQQVHVPDLTDFMNDMFFGTLNATASDHHKVTAYDLTGTADHDRTAENEGGSRKSTSGRSTEEWLMEARRLVASSPSRSESPSRLVGSPRFAAAVQAGPALDRRDPMSRSARRHRAVESFSGEIISKSTGHSRNKSETFTNTNDHFDPSLELSSTSLLHATLSDTINPSNPTPPPQLPPHPPTSSLSRRQSFPRKSRFRQGIGGGNSTELDALPETASESLLRLSPPKNLVESAQRRSVSSSTCSSEKINVNIVARKKPSSDAGASSELSLNAFLKRQRIKVDDGDAKCKFVLSGPSNSTSSMVAAICYSWLLDNRARNERNKGECIVFPVMNVKRASMWKLREASWLFYHVGLDVTSLLFADEVDLEGLLMAGKLSIVVIGQDVLRTNGEVRSQCSILTDNYCEEAYDLLQTPMLKKLLLAAILLDTQNLNSSSQLSMTRDAEAVQLLLVGLKMNYRNALFDQLTQDQRDESFLEALQHSYGKPLNENGHETKDHVDSKVPERNSTTKNSDRKTNDAKSAKCNKISPKSEKPISPLTPPIKVSPTSETSRGKSKFFLAKWFGFGSK